MTGHATQDWHHKVGVKAYVWGYNNTGELGVGHAARVFAPSPAVLPAGVVDVQGGANFTVALTSSGRVWTWGSNERGQLGDGTRRPRREPQQIRLPDGHRAAGIAAGTDHVLVVTTRGDLITWGRNHRGQLGTGDRDDRLTPKLVRTESVKTVAAGDGISAAITPTGRLLTWGRNGQNQLAQKGSVPAGHDVLKPTRARQVAHPVRAVDAGLRHLVVLTTDGDVYMFGVDVHGKPVGQRIDVPGRWGRVTAIAAGEDHTLALTRHGQIVGWGANDLGQLGTGDTTHQLTPTLITLPGARGEVTEIRAGHRHALALTDRHEVYTWGDGKFGAVGTGRPKPEATSQLSPHRLALPGIAATGLGGGGYTSLVFVRRGPAVRLELDPATATGQPGQSVRYTIRTVDAFGTDLGPAPAGVTVVVPGGTATHTSTRATTVTGPGLGTYSVVARAGHLIGRSTLRVSTALHVSKGSK